MVKIITQHPLSGNKLAKPLHLEIPSLDLMTKSIAIFTIGPVQSFITAAKKVKEFWAGSYLLSFLAWKGLEVIIRTSGEDRIIFPLVKEQPFYQHFILHKNNVDNLELATIPNRFMVLLDQGIATDILEECERTVREELKLIASKCELSVQKGKEGYFQKQIQELLEIYWIILPLTSTYQEERTRYLSFKGAIEDKSPIPQTLYGLATSFAEELLGGRKILRNFKQVKEEGLKCFICGERSAIVQGVEKKMICGICALKRNFELYYKREIDKSKMTYYQPVVEIATIDYKEGLIQELRKDPKLLQELVELLENGITHEDSTLHFLPERWLRYNQREKRLLTYKGDCFDLEGVVLPNPSRLRTLIKRINQEYNLKLNKYYALLYLDGDDMGQWVSGEKTGTISPEIHSLISKALTDYSLQFVKEIVEGNGRRGRIVYAGGDDVVAFVNLADLFPIIRELRAYFSGNIKNGQVDFLYKEGFIEKKSGRILTLGEKATLSLGACIAHYKEPLNLVIRKAQAMEKLAKKVMDGSKTKDALALGLLKHSGETRDAVVKWYYHGFDTIHQGLQPFVKMIRDEKISRSFIYQLKKELEVLEGREVFPIVEDEVKRLVKRKCQKRDHLEVEEVVKNLLTIYQHHFSLNKGNFNHVKNFISLMEILFFLGKRGV